MGKLMDSVLTLNVQKEEQNRNRMNSSNVDTGPRAALPVVKSRVLAEQSYKMNSNNQNPNENKGENIIIIKPDVKQIKKVSEIKVDPITRDRNISSNIIEYTELARVNQVKMNVNIIKSFKLGEQLVEMDKKGSMNISKTDKSIINSLNVNVKNESLNVDISKTKEIEVNTDDDNKKNIQNPKQEKNESSKNKTTSLKTIECKADDQSTNDWNKISDSDEINSKFQSLSLIENNEKKLFYFKCFLRWFLNKRADSQSENNLIPKSAFKNKPNKDARSVPYQNPVQVPTASISTHVSTNAHTLNGGSCTVTSPANQILIQQPLASSSNPSTYQTNYFPQESNVCQAISQELIQQFSLENEDFASALCSVTQTPIEHLNSELYNYFSNLSSDEFDHIFNVAAGSECNENPLTDSVSDVDSGYSGSPNSINFATSPGSTISSPPHLMCNIDRSDTECYSNIEFNENSSAACSTNVQTRNSNFDIPNTNQLNIVPQVTSSRDNCINQCSPSTSNSNFNEKGKTLIILQRKILPKDVFVDEKGLDEPTEARIRAKLNKSVADEWAFAVVATDDDSIDKKTNKTKLMNLIVENRDIENNLEKIYALITKIVKKIAGSEDEAEKIKYRKILQHTDNNGLNSVQLAALNRPDKPIIARFLTDMMNKVGLNADEVIDNDDNRLLHKLAEKGNSHVHVLADLLHSKCNGVATFNVNVKNKFGQTPLAIAVMRHKENNVCHAVVEQLLKHRSIVTCTDNTGKTPLHLAVNQQTGIGDVNLVKKLLGSEYLLESNLLDMVDLERNSALHYVCQRNDWQRQRKLLFLFKKAKREYNHYGKRPLEYIESKKLREEAHQILDSK